MSRFMVWCPDLGSTESDAREFGALDAASAACEWAKREDRHSADYWIVGGQPATVYVRANDGTLSTFIVTGEAEPVYWARPAQQPQGAKE